MVNKVKIGVVLFLLVVSLFFVSLSANVSAQEVSYCCEKTVDGAYCQNAPSEQCDSGFASSPTSCSSTSYCQKGTCYDSDEGVCMENTPKEACEASNGDWSPLGVEEVPQCGLGCCVLGQQAAYTTLQRCKKVSGFYGLKTDFRTDVADEVSCIAIAQSEEKGACVFESDFVKTCKFTTRSECEAGSLGESLTGESVEFYKDYLCTSEELNTDCEKTRETTCLDGKDEVYYIDSCGNPANIYDASKVNDRNYWEKVVEKEDSCAGDGRTCGNCDYLGGSICADKNSAGVSVTYGDYACQDINCYDTSNGKDYTNGESWCYYDSEGNENTDSVGSRQYRHICFGGEEIVEPCADFRQEACVETTIGDDFSQAGCVVNRWQDCVLMNNTQDCLNDDVRDCQWIPIGDAEDLGKYLEGDLGSLVNTEQILGNLLNVRNVQNDIPGRCVPKIAPGLQFWDQSSQSQCDLGSQSCVVKYEEKLIGDKKCVENCFCLEPSTAVVANMICTSLGDCGADSNYIGRFVNEGYEIEIGKGGKDEVVSDERQGAVPGGQEEFGGSSGGEFSTPTDTSGESVPTGNVIREMIKRFGEVK